MSKLVLTIALFVTAANLTIGVSYAATCQSSKGARAVELPALPPQQELVSAADNAQKRRGTGSVAVEARQLKLRRVACTEVAVDPHDLKAA